MSSILKFLFDLGQTLKNLAGFYLAKFKKNQRIAKQNDLDKKVVANLSGRRLNNWRQLKRLPLVLTKFESLALKILALIILAACGYLFYFGWYLKLPTVPTNGGDMSEGLIGNPQYINPILAYSDVDRDLSSLIYSGLLKFDADLNPIPDLAERYEISADQKTYTFYLKKNVTWHDNQPLTADDVLFTISSIQNLDFKSPLYRSFTGIKVSKVDDYTVKFELAEPYAAFLDVLTVGIIPKHIWADIQPSQANLAIYNQKPIGSGPFIFKNMVKEKSGLIISYELTKNKRYFDKIPYLNNLYFKFYPDYQSAIDGLANREVQNLSYLPKDYITKVGKRDLNLHQISMSQYTAVFFNQKNNDQLQDPKVRQALAYAVDKNKIIEDVLQNQGQVIDGPILTGFLGYNTDIKKYEYNPKKALEILTADGWTIEGDLLKKKKNDLKITLTTVDQPETVKVANLIKGFWASIGVNVDLQIVPKEKIETDVIIPRNYQALIYGEIIGYDPDLFPFWHSSQRGTSGLNLSNYVNRQADTLLEDARKTSDPQVRSAKYRDFQNILIADLPAIFLYSPNYTYPANKNIRGIDVTRLASPENRLIDITNWYLKTKKQIFK